MQRRAMGVHPVVVMRERACIACGPKLTSWGGC